MEAFRKDLRPALLRPYFCLAAQVLQIPFFRPERAPHAPALLFLLQASASFGGAAVIMKRCEHCELELRWGEVGILSGCSL